MPVQAWPCVQEPQNPLPSHTWLEPHDTPAMTLVVPSTHVAAPVAHEVTPFLHVFGLPLHPPPAVQETHEPEALQTMLVPQLVPAGLFVSSMHAWTPVVHDVTPFLQAAPGFVVHAWPPAHSVHWPFALHTWFTPQPVPAAFMLPSTHVCTPVVHDVMPL